MKPEQKCVSKETAKAFADAGIVIESEYSHFEHIDDDGTTTHGFNNDMYYTNEVDRPYWNQYPSPDSDELFKYIPKDQVTVCTWCEGKFLVNLYDPGDPSDGFITKGEWLFSAKDEKLSEALAKLALHLRGEGVL